MAFRADILFPVDEYLPDAEMLKIEKDLAFPDGVFSACVSPRSWHLMIVDYDLGLVKSSSLLSTIRRHGVHGEMIGL